MVEELNFTEQFTLINAPAGSGKTTAISNNIKKLLKHSNKKILCITYTNRAAGQLNERIKHEQVQISTIHSFIGNYMTMFFKLRPIINHFGEFFEKEINYILASENEKQIERLNKYRVRNKIDINFTLSKELIINNIDFLEYGETQYTSFLYGKLSHDDLLKFTKSVFEKYPKIEKTVSQQYSHIFIDEYQDTHSEILDLFYNACLKTDIKLILLGDEMQQIYIDRVEKFQETIESKFTKNRSLVNNWRSQEYIVNILNNLYFDPSYLQKPQKKSYEKSNIYIINDFNEIQVSENVLQLVLFNSDLFKEINAYDLYCAYKKKYTEFTRHSTKEILSDISLDNPDDLMVILIFIIEISDLFDRKQYSLLIEKTLNYKFANKEIWKIKSHSDKIKVADQLSKLSEKLKQDICINELLKFLIENEVIYTSHIDTVMTHITSDEIFSEKILKVKIIEFINCYREMTKPRFSTQHAVKGEGYDHVALKISDGNNPNVKMHFFFNLFSKNLFDYNQLKAIDREIKKCLMNIRIGMQKSPSSISANDFKKNSELFHSWIQEIKNILMQNQILYENFFSVTFEKFEEKPNATNFKTCTREANKINGALLAYKLFYVGCSRAKLKLDVYVLNKEISEFRDEFIKKMKEINFEVNVKI